MWCSPTTAPLSYGIDSRVQASEFESFQTYFINAQLEFLIFKSTLLWRLFTKELFLIEFTMTNLSLGD